MKTHIINLETYDDVISTCDKMGWSKSSRILLVWPAHGIILRSKLDIIRIQRRASELGAQLAIVTPDDVVAEIAESCSIPVFECIKEAQNHGWRKQRSSKKVTRGFTSKKSPIDIITWFQVQKRKQSLNPWIRLFAFSVAVASVILLMLFFIPRAEIHLPIIEQSQWLDIDIGVSENVSQFYPNGMVPAHRLFVIVEGRDEAPATSSIEIPDSHAEGQVIFTNITAARVEIPVGTIVSTSEEVPVRFLTTQTGFLEGSQGSTCIVPVVALNGGEEGNVDVNTVNSIEGDIGLRAIVSNPTSIRGGSNRTVLSPSSEDLQNLRDHLLDNLEITALADIERMNAETSAIIPGTITLERVLDESVIGIPGEPADVVQLQVQAEFSVLACEENNLLQIAQLVLDGNLSSGMSGITNTLVNQILGSDTTSDSILLHIRSSRMISSNYSQPMITGMILGTSPESAIRMISSQLNLRSQPEIIIRPTGWFRMPFFPFQIEWIEE